MRTSQLAQDGTADKLDNQNLISEQGCHTSTLLIYYEIAAFDIDGKWHPWIAHFRKNGEEGRTTILTRQIASRDRAAATIVKKKLAKKNYRKIRFLSV